MGTIKSMEVFLEEVLFLKRAACILLVVLMFLSIGQSITYASELPSDKISGSRLVIISMDRVSYRDIDEYNLTNIEAIIKKGAKGLMTTNTGGSLAQKNAYVTLGAGARARGNDKSSICLDANDTYDGQLVKDLYYQMMGREVLDENIVNMGIIDLYDLNSDRLYDINIGAVGDVLRGHGIKTAVFGNSDLPDNPQRYMASFLMDRYGVVERGDVGRSMNMIDTKRPFGIKTDYKRLENAIEKAWDEAQVIGIELGDTSRAENFKNKCTEEMLERYRRIAMEEGDKFIGNILKKVNFDKDIVMFLSPVAPAKDIGRGNRLAPVIITGPNMGNGYLTSSSTRRKGVITNMDVGATILHMFDLPPLPGQLGSYAYSIDEKAGVDEMLEFNERLVLLLDMRHTLNPAYIYGDIIISIAALLIFLFAKRYIKWINILLLFVMIVPLCYLILPVFYTPSMFQNALIALIISLVILALLMYFVPTTVDRIWILSLGLAISLIVDQLTGARLIRDSPLGYDVISGSRFYGMGNEYMGVMIASICTGSCAMLQRLRDSSIGRVITTLIFLMGLFTMVSPRLGANVGGSIAAFIAFLCTICLIYEIKITPRRVISALLLLMALLVGVFLLDNIGGADAQSHMGQTVKLIRENGIKELFIIFKRKISMNIKLIRYTIWSKVFLTSLILIVVLFFKPTGLLRRTFERFNIVKKGLIGATAGAIAALLANDSGIVAAATAMIYIAPPITLLMIEELNTKEVDS